MDWFEGEGKTVIQDSFTLKAGPKNPNVTQQFNNGYQYSMHYCYLKSPGPRGMPTLGDLKYVLPLLKACSPSVDLHTP